MEQPVLKKKLSLSPIWILPLVALCIGGWLLYESFRDAGIEITIHFADAKGITPGKTKVIAKGIPVGTVTEVKIDDDLQGVSLIIEMEGRTRKGLVEDTKFWLVKPEISAGRISGLDTLLTGSYIGVQKGKSTVFTSDFEGLTAAPPLETTMPGLHLTIETDKLYSLQRGSNIYSKNLQIGHIDDYALQESGNIRLKAYIKPEFVHLIREGTRFWNSSGLSISGDLQSGLSVDVESIAALIYGGVTCATPATLKDTKPADNDTPFTLYKDFEDAQYGLNMTLQLASGNGIVPGKTRVMYRGLKAGVIKSVDINKDRFNTVTATILLDPRAEVILRKNTKFWVIQPQVSLTGIKHLETLLTGPYITFEIGEGVYKDHFIVEPKPMPNPILVPGTTYTLISPDSGSLQIGAPVLYKQMTVGEITNIVFAEGGKLIHTTILIYQPHEKLVRDNTVFWNVSGIQVDASLSNLKINLASLQTMLAGGVAFTTPQNTANLPSSQAQSGKIFPLYDGYGDMMRAVPELQPTGLRVQLHTPQAPPLKTGAPVLYNNIKVGEILNFHLGDQGRDVIIELLIQEQHKNLITTTSRFYNFSGFKINASLQGVNLETSGLDAIINGGVAFFNQGSGTAVSTEPSYRLYNDYQHALHSNALRLTLHLNNGAGIGKNTNIKFQGIDIGKIVSIGLDNQTGGVTAIASVTRETAKLFRQDTILWLVKPKISLSGIEHLDTVLSGTYIEVTPGTAKRWNEFHVLEQTPGSHESYAGLNITLEAPRLGSLKKGSPVYYRQVQVGQVTGYKLSPTAQAVWVQVNIEPAYALLIYDGTRFWNASGIKVSGGVLSGLQINTESMESLIRGGIALATPEGMEMGAAALSGDHFALAPRAEPAWLEWQPHLPPDPTQKLLEPEEQAKSPSRVRGEEVPINE